MIKELGPHYEVYLSDDGEVVYWHHVLDNGKLGNRMMVRREADEVLPMIVRALARWDAEHA